MPNGTFDPNKKKLVAPNITPNVMPNTTDFLGTVQRFTGQPGTAQAAGVPGVMQTATGALQESLQKSPQQAAADAAARESKRLEGLEATEKQQFQDVLGKTGRTGTARGIQDVGQLLTQQGQRRIEETREARMGAEKAASEEQARAIESALGFGQLGVTEAGQKAETALGAADVLGRKDIAGMQIEGQMDVEKLRQMSETDRQTALLGFQGNQADLDRALTREVEAGRLSQAEADRLSSERMTIAQITSQEKLTYADLSSREKMADLDRIHESKLAADTNYLQQQGIDVERARIEGYTDANGNHVMGDLEIKGKQLGLAADTLDLQRQEVMGNLTNEAERLSIARAGQDLAEQTSAWEKVMMYAELLPEEQAAAFIAETARSIGMNVPEPVDKTEADAYLAAANGDPEEARRLAMADDKVFIGADGVSTPAPGETQSNPIGVTAIEAPTARVGQDSPMYWSPEGWMPMTEGQHVEFSRSMTSDIGFAIPAGTYQLVSVPVSEGVSAMVYQAADGTMYLAQKGPVGAGPDVKFGLDTPQGQQMLTTAGIKFA